MAKKEIEFVPTLQDQKIKRYKGDLWIRRNIAGQNLGSFYTSLYSALFGGEVSPIFKGNHDILPNGELRNHNPDIVLQKSTNTTEIEIKSISLRDNRISMGREQLENYFNALLVNYLLKGEKNSEFKLGIFRYGHPKKYVNLHFYSTQKATEILSRSTHELVIMPSNLALFSFIAARHQARNRDGTKSETKCTAYHRFYSKFLTALANEEDPMNYLFSMPFQDNAPEAFASMYHKVIAELIFDKLLIDKLDFRRFSSEEIGNINCRGYNFKPFQITQFFMQEQDRQKWLKQLAKHHRYFLEDLVGVRDLYEENYGVPF